MGHGGLEAPGGKKKAPTEDRQGQGDNIKF